MSAIEELMTQEKKSLDKISDFDASVKKKQMIFENEEYNLNKSCVSLEEEMARSVGNKKALKLVQSRQELLSSMKAELESDREEFELRSKEYRETLLAELEEIRKQVAKESEEVE